MKKFIKEIQLRWSDLDPNFHLRHSIYYDWGAFCRIEFLREFDLTAHIMQRTSRPLAGFRSGLLLDRLLFPGRCDRFSRFRRDGLFRFGYRGFSRFDRPFDRS